MKFSIRTRMITMGHRKGQRVYYAYPKAQSKLTLEMVVERIQRATSLTEGDVHNALISLGNVVYEALSEGQSVDLGRLGSFRVMVPPNMMDKEEDVVVPNAFKKPKIIYTPKKAMKIAASKVSLTIEKKQRKKQG